MTLRPTDRAAEGAPGTNNPETPAAPPATAREKRRAWFKRIGGRIVLIGRRRRRTAPEEPNPSSGLRILIVTDAWKPQVNGVVRTLEMLIDHLTRMGNTVRVISPDMFRTVPLPTYPEIRLALVPNRKIAKIINSFQPDAIHIATEGTLGMAARRFCVRRQHPYTTSLHTRFPEYLHARFRFPISWGYALMRWFHNPASAVMVATPSLMEEMREKGFRNLRIWSRGVDVKLFKPGGEDARAFLDHPRPIWLYVGRIAVEKSIEDFLGLDLEGTKLVIGDGPQAEELKRKYPDAVFLGSKFGEDLARHYAASDVFVFPSRTDTFGLVNVEALASGIPVAAYPVQGPRDILESADPPVGAMDEDLGAACRKALGIATPEQCRKHALKFTWDSCTRQFLSNLDLPGYDESYWLESAEIPD
jgi:glycosyltransferase involved in cell wall biosynthesis